MKKLEEKTNRNKITRNYLISAIGISLIVWNVSFYYGAFGVIFYEKFFAVWVITIVTIMADVALNKQRILKGWSLLAMLTPTLLLAFMFWDNNIAAEQYNWSKIVITVVTAAIILFLLPYAAYLILSITHKQNLRMFRSRLGTSLVIIVVIVGMLGIFIGKNNDYFLRCQDFTVSGNYEPSNCKP